MFKIDFQNERAIEWSRKNGNLHRMERVYRPSLYISGKKDLLKEIRYKMNYRIYSSKFEQWRLSPGKSPEQVLRIDVEKQEDFKNVRNYIRRNFPRHLIRFFHAGLSPQFKYCIEEGRNPEIFGHLKVLKLELSRPRIAERSLEGLKIDGDSYSEKSALKALKDRFDGEGPDVLIINRTEVLTLIDDKTEFPIGRGSGLEKLAGENTVSAYGKMVHSPSRYSVSGRAVVDESSSFMLSEAGMEGLHDLTSRSWKPLQEIAWASIGNILTAIEIRNAYSNNILTPWKNWTPETPKKASTMRKADRGGFIFNPRPKVYEDVHEMDFASLFPNIMVEKNISPETVNCNCCNNSIVPELGYSICEKQIGFIPHILAPIIYDRSRFKEKNTEYSEKASKALKWILVSCFGYMGHAHAAYGAIECHQAIQAYDRKIMVNTKEILEKEGFEIKHGIIDSIWVSAPEKQTEVEKICEKVSDNIGIELEHETHFEWVAFVPRKNSDISTLNRYFGKTVEGEIITAGIEIEQSSAPKIVKECQKEMIQVVNESPKEAINILEKYIQSVESGLVDKNKLVIEKKITRAPGDYKSKNRSAEAAQRMERKGINIRTGEKVKYIIRDQDTRPRILLDFEEVDRYDPDFYVERLYSAAESILRPFEAANNIRPNSSETLADFI